MIVLVEAYHYRADDVAGLIDNRYLTPVGSGRVKLNYVGYLAGDGQPHSLLILPKVFLRREQGRFYLLGSHTPEDLLTLPQPGAPLRQQLQQQRLPNGQSTHEFLFRFSVWLYRAIRQFRQRHPGSVLPEQAGLTDVSDAGQAELSELELVLALVRFHRDNTTLLTYTKRISTAQRQTVSWSRTVARQQPVLQNGQPVYVRPLVKQKQINYDEELIVMLLTTLDDLRREYGFRLELNPLYPLVPVRERARFRARASRRLREIRANYFSDKLLRAWQLLVWYYARQDRLRAGRTHREVLLVRDFNVVFEDMIDQLLSDPDVTLPPGLRDQPDGKVVDHIYADRDLIRPDADQIYHIGDSKYYKPDNEIGTESVAKQFTYARNVIQYNIDLLNANKLVPPLRYRDELTEGYNPTPNFFISATIDALAFDRSDLCFRQSYDHNRHFVGRLFDRDTLLLQAYNINFLFVLHSYVSPDGQQRSAFRQQARQEFRQRLVGYLQTHYQFYQLTFTDEDQLSDFVTRWFRALAGRMYRPSDFSNALLLATPTTGPDYANWPQRRAELEAEADIKPFSLIQ
jgi:hypothetical protein